MKAQLIIIFSLMTLMVAGQPDADEIIRKVDENMTAETIESEEKMIVYGRRSTRTMTSHSFARGDKEAFTEYLSPPREQGTKMLKLEDRLWIYSPSTDRTIQISGHMLRQSVMGSDMSYEDVMEERELLEIYNAEIVGEETINGRKTWVIELNAKVDDATYESRKTWVDQERHIPLKEQLYAKSGQLLKRVELSEVKKFDNRWYPTKMNYKDVLKEGKGTDFIIIDIKFNHEIPEYIFSKASLKK
ncbi:MAG TPA: outer membrane lipoprotein-sorting protein [Bacteroidales bacterium]|nr:outer membrane lipoprotein-sorting protein [Bacteroidales bacterium]